MLSKANETHALLKARLEGTTDRGSSRAPTIVAPGHAAAASTPDPALAAHRPARIAKPLSSTPPPVVEPPAMPQAEVAQPAAVAEAPVDERKSKRRSTRIGAVIQLDDGMPGVFCSVRDMSATGALLSLTGGGRHDFAMRPRDLPHQFWLHIKQDRMQVPCEIIRRVGQEEIGVRFLAAPTFY